MLYTYSCIVYILELYIISYTYLLSIVYTPDVTYLIPHLYIYSYVCFRSARTSDPPVYTSALRASGPVRQVLHYDRGRHVQGLV